MRSKRNFWLGAVAAVGLLLSATNAVAQDFSRLSGDNANTGKNATPDLSGPGRSQLRWFTPNAADNIGGTIFRNNTALAPNVSFAGAWSAPPADGLASFVYDGAPTGNRDGDEASGAAVVYGPDVTHPYNYDGRSPAYLFSNTIPASLNDPTIKANAADTLSTFTWTMDPTKAPLNETGTSRNYALYVWIPIGSTGPAPGSFPQRYFVYDILYGTGQRWIEVIDTYLSGPGWIRLGGGGFPTNKLFFYNGINPIQIRLYNTVPRNKDGTLSDTPYTTTVYADGARAVPEVGSYTASPTVSQFTGTLGTQTRTVSALNVKTVATRDGSGTTVEQGVVTSRVHDTGALVWSFNLAQFSPYSRSMDNDNPGVTQNPAPPTAGSWASQVGPGNFLGVDYLTNTIQNTSPAGASIVTYAPTLEDGDYDIQVYLSGDVAGEAYGHGVVYEIHEGPAVTNVTLDQSQGPGWYKLGTRRFAHDSALAPLTVVVTNYSADPTDATRKVYADSVRFLGAVNLTVTSTPIQTTALVRPPGGGAPIDTPVVIVAGEDGRIYCLDAQGNANGTTNVIWAYPSIPDASNPSWTDPNQVAGLDGPNGIAEMPVTGFGKSSGLVQRINGADYLFIGAENGRVYCIDMAGRGDGNFATGKAGTTTRVWSYPNDYPAGPAKSSNLGPFVGSLAYANTAQGPTIFAPTTQGRLYALDAVGVPASKITTPRWTFPARTAPVVGEILTSPVVEFGRVYFGTGRLNDEPGELYALNADTGNQVWRFTGGSTPASEFESTPTTVSAALLGGGMPDTIFVGNDNLFVYAIDAATGTLLWETNELNAAPFAPLTYTPMTVFNNAGTMEIDPVIMVPTSDGKFAGLFARQAGAGSTNRFGTKRAYQYNAASGVVAGLAVGRNWMYGADQAGNLYAFNDNPSNQPPISPGIPPGQDEIVENNPVGDVYRDAKIGFITKTQYQRLRLDNTDPQALGYSQVVPPMATPNKAFEWGETVYMLVYDFPYDKTDANGNPVTEPVVNFTISTDGAVTRQFAIVSRQWRAGSGYPNATADSSIPLDGYAILAFPIQGSGPNALPPGGGQISFSITTSSLGSTNAPQQIAPNPNLSRINFLVANPLALAMRMTGPTTADPLRSIGFTTDPNDPQNLIDGTRDVNSPAFPGNNEARLAATAGQVQHAGSGSADVWVVDRSLMTLLRGPGRGLDQLRASRNRMAWQGGLAAVIKPLPSALYPNMEDLPVNFPNDSIDYGDIPLEQIRVVKDPTGAAENPVFSAVSLLPPLNVDENAPLTRTLVPTLFQFWVDVPRYQPANLSTILDSAGSQILGGYADRVQVFVDSDGSGTLSSLGGRREAYRSFTFATAVGVDENLAVRTPLVDLGSLPSGAGYSPAPPGAPTGAFSPWAPPFGTAAPDFYSMFRPFVIENPGNVNLLNVRLAKNTRVGTTTNAWPIFADANDIYAWLDANANVFTDFDLSFGLQGPNYSILQKPRVGDRVATQFAPNPGIRENANLGVLPGFWNPAMPTAPGENVPRVAVTLPLGFPQGVYTSIMRVIEDYNGDEALQINGGGTALEPFSDPTFTIRWNTREVRLTSSNTKTNAPMIDDRSVVGAGNFQWANTQPAAVRAANGALLVAYASTRTSFTAPQPTDASVNDQYRIYIGTVGTGTPSVATNPLRDLNFMSAASNSQWFNLSAATANGYPSGPMPPLFLTQPGETIDPNSVRFGAPNFPTLGFANPYSPNTTFNQTFMVFIGEAQKGTAGGRVNESRIFVTTVSVAADGSLTLGAPVPMPFDAQIPKSRPSIVQVSATRAIVFYSAAGTGQPQVYYSQYDQNTGFTAPKELGVGDGFESANGPSGVARLYTGGNIGGVGADHLVEISFTGKLRGRQNSEVFFARMTTDGNGSPLGLTFLPLRNFEPLTPEREAGVFRAGGVQWNRRNTIQLWQTLNGVTTNLEVANTRQLDRSTGLITMDTTLGGKAYLDPNLGTVRFASGIPSRNAVLQLTYQPRILRASANTASGFSGTSLLFDNRIVADLGYWARPDGSAAQANDTPRSGRMLFTYNRAAAGGGQTARPFMRTMRFGVQLPHAIYTAPDGSVSLPAGGLSVTVGGATGFYQIDPANGRIYFEAVDEDRDVTITYFGIDPSSGAPVPFGAQVYRVGLVSERTEQPLPIEQAVNETGLTTLLDPADSASWRRPGLIWMFWSSTRTGGSDIYFQTIAPRFTPVTGK